MMMPPAYPTTTTSAQRSYQMSIENAPASRASVINLAAVYEEMEKAIKDSINQNRDTMIQ